MNHELNEPQASGDHAPSEPSGAEQKPPSQPVGAPADAGDAGDAGGSDSDWGYSTIRESPAPDDSIRGVPAPGSEPNR